MTHRAEEVAPVLRTEYYVKDALDTSDLVYYANLGLERGYAYWDVEVDDTYDPPFVRLVFFNDRKDLKP